MNWRKIIDTVLTLNLLGIILFGAYLWWSGQLQIEYTEPKPTTSYYSPTEAAQLLGDTLREEVDRQIGVPIEGYEPQMFLSIFPGLAATDFEGVQASIGKYVVVEGQLVHVLPPNVLVHSAAASVTQRGVETLLINIAARNQIDLQNGGTLTDVMNAISQN